MEQGMAGYLFVHFTGEQKDGEQICFSVSRDGLYWILLSGSRKTSFIGKRSVPIRSASVRQAVSGRRKLCLMRKSRYF